MMKCLSLIFILFLATCIGTKQAAKANEPPTEVDGKSENMDKPFTVFLNTATSSLNGTYLWQDPESSVKFGIESGGKAINGIQNIWGGEDNTSEYTAKVFMAFSTTRITDETAPDLSPQTVVEFGIDRNNYALLESEMSNEIRTQTQTSPSMSLYYSRSLYSNVLAGVSVGYAKLNNYATLGTRQIVKSRSTTPTDSEENVDVVVNTLTAREGIYKALDSFQTSIDLLCVSDVRQYKLAFNLFFSYTYQHNHDHLFEPGFGIFSLREITPSAPQNEKSDAKATEPSEEGDSVGKLKDSGQKGANPRDGAAATASLPTNLSMLGRASLPWEIKYGVVGQWKDDIGEFRFGAVVGYNF